MNASSAVRPGRSRGWVAALGAAGLALGGCATHVTVTRLRPAELDLGGLQHVVVTDLGGNDGHALGAELTRALFDARALRVLEPAALADVPRTDIALVEATGLGRLPPAALVLGDAEATASNDVSRRSTVCVGSEPDRQRDRDRARKDDGCVEYTRKVAVSYVASVNVVDSRTGAVVAARVLRCRRSRETSAVDARPPLVTTAELISPCRTEIVSEIVPLLVPTSAEEELVLVEDETLPGLAEGNRLAKAGDWAGAHAAYTAAVARAGSSPGLAPRTRARAWYALGVSLLSTGRLDDGIAALRSALDAAPDGEAAELLPRALRWRADAERLRAQAAPAAAPTGG